MKRLILLLPILLSSFLFADDLTLEDIVIKGQSSAVIDSAKFEMHPQSEWKFNKISLLDFYHQNLPKMKDEQIAKEDYLLDLSLGNPANLSATFMVDKAHNFGLQFFRKSPEDDWSTTDFNVSYKHDNFSFIRFDYLGFLSENKLSDETFQYNSAIIKLADLQMFNPLLSTYKFSTFNLGINPIMQNNYTAKSSTIFNANMDLKIEPTENYQIDVTSGFYQKFLSGSIKNNFENVKYLGNIGFWCGYDENGFYPSLSYKYHARWENIYFNFDQNPQLKPIKLPLLYQENSYQEFNNLKFSKKEIVNSTFDISFVHFIEASVFYNYVYTTDEYFYFQSTPTSLYQIATDDFQKHKLGFSLVYAENNFSIRNKGIYQIIDQIDGDWKHLPYRPNIENITEFDYLFSKFRVKIQSIYQAKIKDEFENSIDNRLILNSNISYKFKKNLFFRLNGKNLFNSDYQEFQNTPKNGLEVTLGAKWLF